MMDKQFTQIGFQVGPTFPTIPTFPLFFLLLFLENVLLYLYFFTLKCHLCDKKANKIQHSLRSLEFYKLAIIFFGEQMVK